MKVDIAKLQAEVFAELCELCSEDGLDRQFAISEIYGMQDGDVEIGHVDLAVHKLVKVKWLRAVRMDEDGGKIYVVTPEGYEEYLSSD